MNSSSRRRRWLHRFRAPVEDAPSDPTDRADRAGFVLLLGAIGLAPLANAAPSGLVRLGPAAMPGSVTGPALLEVAAFLATAVTFLSRARARSLKPLRVPLAAFAAFAIFGVFQLIPVPDGFLKFVAPVNRGIYHETAEVLSLFGVPAPIPRVSIVPSETAHAVVSLLACLALFLASANLVRNRARRRAFGTILVLAATARIFLVVVGGRAASASATAAAAAHGEIALALCFGAVWAEALTGGRRVRDEADRAERLEGRALPLAARLIVWAVVASGLVLAGSTAAVRAAAATTLALVFAAIRHRRVRGRRGSTSAVAPAAAVVAVLAIAMAGAPLLFGGGHSTAGAGRSDLQSALEAWRLFPAIGSGLGTLREALRRVQPSGPPEELGDVLQVLVTGGIVGVVLAVTLFVLLFKLLFSAWRTQRHRVESAFVLAGVGAMFSLALHASTSPALVDPTVAASLASVAGAAWAAGRAA